MGVNDMKRRQFLGAGAGVLAAGTVVSANSATRDLSVPATEVYDMGNRRELFVDDFLVDTIEGELNYRLHSPHPQEQVIRQDKPWEV